MLPIELVFQVIEHLHSDKPTLSSCSILSRACLRLARPLLFRRLVITCFHPDILSRGSDENPIRFLSENPDVGSLIRAVVFRKPLSHNDPHVKHSLSLSVLVATLSRLPALTDLRLEGLVLDVDRYQYMGFFHIKGLQLIDLERTAPSKLIPFITLFFAIGVLTIHYEDGDTGDEEECPPTFGAAPTVRVREAILRVRADCWAYLSQLGRILCKATSLTELELEMRLFTPSAYNTDVQAGHALPFGLCSSLRTLTVLSTLPTAPRAYGTLADATKLVAMGLAQAALDGLALAELRLIVDMAPGYVRNPSQIKQRIPWGELDGALAALPCVDRVVVRFRVLSFVDEDDRGPPAEVLRDDREVTEGHVRGWMPRIVAAGVTVDLNIEVSLKAIILPDFQPNEIWQY
ncbi:uncharacterized protein BXZ73DRAFT_97631 [Epithele typhae]|uniref:uncharacterized protein n=1 Tax=Epithele typhae TaxID=378194 RepID=UPI00200845DA|nr:uncharacterized protein BXZ73DRAFT_97631 [Epithele typhae]KAH9942211.1 hypothetical protein BXZ73DRAFT_97631 [Epithele typhae]